MGRAVVTGGYSIRLGCREYSGWRDGRPFTLADAWREVEGVGGATILRPDGSVALRHAGAMSTRSVVASLRRAPLTSRVVLAGLRDRGPRRRLP